MIPPHVLIVGAGPTGLTAAVELARRGIIPVVIEKRKSPSHLSRAVGILPRSMNILAPSGVAQSIRKEAVVFQRAIVHYKQTLLTNIKLNIFKGQNNRLYGLAQDRTEAHLYETFIALGGKVVFGAEFLSLSQNDAGISTSILGRAFRFDIVIGADGVHSSVRDALHIDFNGYELPELWSIADVNAKGWKSPRCFQSFILDQGGVVVVVPIAKGRFRIIANRAHAMTALPVPMQITKVHNTAKFRISVRQAQTYQSGRVFLAGDAAHCHSPVGGRGMNLGIADAAELAEPISRGTNDAYTKSRFEVGRKTIKHSERVRRAITSTHPAIRLFVRGFLRLINRSPYLQSRFTKRVLDL